MYELWLLGIVIIIGLVELYWRSQPSLVRLRAMQSQRDMQRELREKGLPPDHPGVSATSAPCSFSGLLELKRKNDEKQRSIKLDAGKQKLSV